jgi:hypothetical protein
MGLSVSASSIKAVLMAQTAEKMQLSEFNPSVKNMSSEKFLSTSLIKKIEYEHHIQPCYVTNQQYITE